jgi:hypothetical protein
LQQQTKATARFDKNKKICYDIKKRHFFSRKCFSFIKLPYKKSKSAKSATQILYQRSEVHWRAYPNEIA